MGGLPDARTAIWISFSGHALSAYFSSMRATRSSCVREAKFGCWAGDVLETSFPSGQWTQREGDKRVGEVVYPPAVVLPLTPSPTDPHPALPAPTRTAPAVHVWLLSWFLDVPVRAEPTRLRRMVPTGRRGSTRSPRRAPGGIGVYFCCWGSSSGSIARIRRSASRAGARRLHTISSVFEATVFYLDPHHSRPAAPLRPFVPSTSTHAHTTSPSHDSMHNAVPEAHARGESISPKYGYRRERSMSPVNYARAPTSRMGTGTDTRRRPMTEDEVVRAPDLRTSYLSTNADDTPSTVSPPAGTSLARGGGTLRARVQRRRAPHLPLRAEWEDLRRRVSELPSKTSRQRGPGRMTTTWSKIPRIPSWGRSGFRRSQSKERGKKPVPMPSDGRGSATRDIGTDGEQEHVASSDNS
ncbi:hypothetical protein B0H14DRAFT_2646042 [Mycena olivaceomarginata]|nr:hypothetical protein B0H14DRAFT_2646042 [Mycena olivaceomarginata]